MRIDRPLANNVAKVTDPELEIEDTEAWLALQLGRDPYHLSEVVRASLWHETAP